MEMKSVLELKKHFFFSPQKTIRKTYSIDVLWSGCVGSVGSVALKGEVVFGPKRYWEAH